LGEKFKVVYKHVCTQCHVVTQSEDNLIQTLDVAIPDSEDVFTIQQLIEIYLCSESLKSCDLCTSSCIKSEGTLLNPPATLIFNLKRYKWCNEEGTFKKIKTSVFIDPVLNLLIYCNSPETILYRLCSIVTHHGSEYTSGHYTTLRNYHDPEEISEFDDITITKHRSIDISEDSYIAIYDRHISKIPCSCKYFLFLIFECHAITNAEIPFAHEDLRRKLANIINKQYDSLIGEFSLHILYCGYIELLII